MICENVFANVDIRALSIDEDNESGPENGIMVPPHRIALNHHEIPLSAIPGSDHKSPRSAKPNHAADF
jgi:hypothetical protein